MIPWYLIVFAVLVLDNGEPFGVVKLFVVPCGVVATQPYFFLVLGQGVDAGCHEDVIKNGDQRSHVGQPAPVE